MAEVVVFHHALGLTDAVRRFADELGAAGHTVHTPDLYGGRTFETIDDGMAYADELGGPMTIVDRARAAVASLPSEVVYIGFSLGVLSAQALAQTRPGARGAVLCYSAVPLGQWGDNWPAAWPDRVRLQLHILDGDEDFEIAQGLAASVPGAELFVYGGSEHYFAEHDEQAAGLLMERVLDFLALTTGRGGASMSGKPKWQVARLDDIERRGRDIPVREHLGIHAFGVNAYTPAENGTLISEHDEAGSGQEELYVVLDGNATFEVDGETVDAPAGTYVYVAPESRRTATGDGTILAVGATPGEAYEAIDWGEAWSFHSESMKAYGEQRYGDALEAVRGALERMPDHAGLNYNYACFATLAGETGDDTFAHLRRSVELRPRFRDDARRDDDFAAVRDDPRFEEALR